MKQYADIVVFDKNGQLALIAEVKGKRGTSSQWAAQMRRNMYAHNVLPDVPYFLLALPDRFYLWKNAGKSLEPLQPTQQVDPTPFLQAFYKKSGVSPDKLTGKSFELIVASWLNEILRVGSPRDLQDKTQEWVISSGLFDRLSGGRLELETAA